MELSCTECHRPFTPDPENFRTHCFRCHVSGISFKFVGGGFVGRRSFHDSTIGEAQREIVEGAAAQGIEVRKVSTRAELI